MKIKRIQPKELPIDLVFRLNHVYRAELGEFRVIADRSKEILYVNKTIPKKDIDRFLEVIAFPDYAVADEESPLGEFLDYVYHKYGFHTYSALMDCHSWQMEQKEKEKAKENAKVIIPLIEKEIDSEMPIVEYDERLIHEIYCAGLDRREKTPKNVSGFGNVYLFYLGYLMGAGRLEGGAE